MADNERCADVDELRTNFVSLFELAINDPGNASQNVLSVVSNHVFLSLFFGFVGSFM